MAASAGCASVSSSKQGETSSTAGKGEADSAGENAGASQKERPQALVLLGTRMVLGRDYTTPIG